MLYSIKIQNFQSHHKSKMEFHPGVNVIVGDTDSGKSAILRSLRWLAYGKPRGEGFRTHGSKETSVSIDFKDAVIIRKRSNSENSYTLFVEESTEPLVFRAVGQEIPIEIEDVINMAEFNFQHQIDSPFLLSESAGGVAAYFNKMANLQMIDISTSNVQSKILKIERTYKAKRQDLRERKKSLQQYSYLDTAESIIAQSEEFLAQRKISIEAKLDIEDILEEFISYEEKIQEEQDIAASERFVSIILTMLEEKKTSSTEFSGLDSLIRDFSSKNQSITKIEKITMAEPDVIQLLALSEELVALENTEDYLLSVLEDIVDVRKRLQEGQIFLQECEAQYASALPDTCPLCEHIIQKD